MHLILSLSFLMGSARAVVPAERSSRQAFVATKLLDLELSARARADLKDMPYWRNKSVGDFLRLDHEARRESIERRVWIEREIARAVAQRELRLDLSQAELDLWIERGRIPHPSRLSAVSAMPFGPLLRRLFAESGCQTLGQVRERFLNPMIFALAPLSSSIAREMREELTQLPLPEGEMVLTLEEARFAEALAEARLGQRTREMLRDRGVTTFATLAEFPIDALATRSLVDGKIVRQIRSFLRASCDELLSYQPRT